MTGVRPLRSKAFSKGTRSDDSSRAQKTTNRFSRAAVKIMRDWLDTHLSRPYPSDEEKVELETSTGLKPAQIATWLANARRRNKSAKSSRRGSLSGSPNTSSEALAIPGPSNTTTWSEVSILLCRPRAPILTHYSSIHSNDGSTRPQRTNLLRWKL